MEQVILNGITVEQLLERFDKLLDRKLSKIESSKEQEDPGLLSRKEVAKLLKITLPTLNDWSKEGRLQSYKIGKRVLYKAQEVKDALHQVSNNKFKKA